MTCSVSSSRTAWPVILAACLLLAACGSDSPVEINPSANQEVCAGFGNWQASAYVLPYPVGTRYEVDQSNCSGFGHSGPWRYGYDFMMDIGTPVTASRAGVVVESVGDIEDGDGSATNLVIIEHADGTFMLYAHLTRNGNLVAEGDTVREGQGIGLSGNTGYTGGLPHLHVSLHTCSDLDRLADAERCPTLPFNYRNTAPNPQGPPAGTTPIAGPH